jgi:molecular chaperone Hsp33
MELSVSSDQIIHATIPGENVRLLAGVTTGVVAEICRRHGTWPAASAALGRTVTGALLMGLMQKDLERVTVQFTCNGPIKGIVATADAHGNARGYVTNPTADAPLVNGKLNVAGVVGSGMMYVTREAGFEIGLSKEPYRGAVEIVSGEIAQDFTYYLAKSEQIPSGVSLGVFVAGDLEVTAAGGFIVQLMPDADEALADELTVRLGAAPHATEMVRSGATPLEMLQTALGRTDLEILETRDARFACLCSPERALQIVGGLGRAVVEDMVSKNTGEEIVCHVCNERYFIDIDAIRGLAEEEGGTF